MDIADNVIERVRNVTNEAARIPLPETRPENDPSPGARSENQSSGEGSTKAGVEWKKYLSGALSEIQLKMAMFILCFFYAIYTLHNAFFLDNDERDEGDIIRNCTCKDHHRNFYMSLLVVCFASWLILHSLYTLAEAFPAVTKSLQAKIMIKVCNCISYVRGYVPIWKKNEDEIDFNTFSDRERKIKKKSVKQIKQCKNFLWSQCYEMYAIGKKKRCEQFNLTDIEKLIIRSLSPEIGCEEKLENSSSTGDFQNNTDSGAHLGTHNLSQNPHVVKHTIVFLFHSLLVIVRFIAQLSVVPLLIAQMIDTYTLLCLAERDYCDRVSQYKLHLDQTALSFAFYCSLMISLLVTIWLSLVPQPKLEVCNCTSHRDHIASSARLEEANNDN